MINHNTDSPAPETITEQPSFAGLRELGASALGAVVSLRNSIRESFVEVSRGVQEIGTVSAVMLPLAVALIEITSDEAAELRRQVAELRTKGRIDETRANEMYEEIDKKPIDDDQPIADSVKYEKRGRDGKGNWEQGK